MKNVKECGIVGDKSFYIDIKDEESDIYKNSEIDEDKYG